MTVLICLAIAYFFFMTEMGQKLFANLVKEILFYSFVFLNPISLCLAIGIYLVIRGSEQ